MSEGLNTVGFQNLIIKRNAAGQATVTLKLSRYQTSVVEKALKSELLESFPNYMHSFNKGMATLTLLFLKANHDNLLPDDDVIALIDGVQVVNEMARLLDNVIDYAVME